jgi:putative RNA 2'-phosphotransferase
MNEKELIKKSRFLSLILRHEPEKLGLTLDKNGWVPLYQLLSKMDMDMTTLEEIVATNDKKRFEFNGDKTRIRACQGHSVEVDLQLNRRTPPEFLYHGTQRAFLDSIKKEGLVKGKRNHVHLSADIATATKVGNRHGSKTVVLTIKSGEMYTDTFKFYISTNNVWLTDFVPYKYIII